MTTEWLSNNDAVANVKRLLNQMGIPLENRVARICADADRWFRHLEFDNNMVHPGRTLYGNPNQDIALREIDQTITIRSHLMLGNEFDPFIEMQVLIECKHREGLAVFGFPFRSGSVSNPTNPVITELAFTDFARKMGREVAFLKDEKICTIGLLENMHRSPKISEEQLVYKAGASLYDFIRFQVEQVTLSAVDPLILEMGILDNYIQSFDEKDVYSWQISATVAQSIDEATVHAFIERYSDEMQIWAPPFLVFVPIVCVDAPLFQVEMSDDGEIQTIHEVPWLLTSARLPKWPGVMETYLLRPTPEALISVVNVSHLGDFFDLLAQWFNDMGQTIQLLEFEEAVKYLLQNALMRSIKDKIRVIDADESKNIWRI